jgi:hypothetical protein
MVELRWLQYFFFNVFGDCLTQQCGNADGFEPFDSLRKSFKQKVEVSNRL